MIFLTEATKGWKRLGECLIAPAALSWVEWGSRLKIGNGVSLGNYARLGDDVRLGNGAQDPTDLGFADGYRKSLAVVDGVAFIGAGCRWFTLDAALEHWGNHTEDRGMTMCLLQSAVAIAKLKGWRQA